MEVEAIAAAVFALEAITRLRSQVGGAALSVNTLRTLIAGLKSYVRLLKPLLVDLVYSLLLLPPPPFFTTFLLLIYSLEIGLSQHRPSLLVYIEQI